MSSHWHKNREGVEHRKRIFGMQDPDLTSDPDGLIDRMSETPQHLGQEALSETVIPPAESWVATHLDELEENQWETDGGCAWPTPEE